MTDECGDKEDVINFLCQTKFYSLLEKDIDTQVGCLNPKANLELVDLAPLVSSGFFHDSALRKDGRHSENNKSCGPPYSEITTVETRLGQFLFLSLIVV